ncbi:MAG: TonB-dependent receptor [Woeseiaceae bacterium]|nr:TonB-dependent receptor [Woeseiaceae bacterium]
MVANSSLIRARMNRFLCALGAIAAALSVSSTANAQEENVVLEEIIVVSQKREQTLQSLPVAVSVVSSATLDEAQILDVKDLQSLVPSLRISQLQTSANTNFLIRGFGNGANNAGIEPSVGVFIDGVYRSRSASALADFPNLERIEVIKGPQSTLFGKNASAGVINVITEKPSLDSVSGSVSVTAGEYSQIILKGDVNGPLSDTFAVSVSGSYNERDGYYDNLETGNSLNELNRQGVRGQALWVPNETFEARLIADWDKLDEACCGVANLQNGPTGAAIALVGGQLVPNAPFAYEGFYDFDPNNEIENSGVSLQLDWDLNESVTLTSITAFRSQERFDNADVDFTSAALISDQTGNLTDTNIDTFTQELRLTGSAENFDWVLGGFFFDEDVDQNSGIIYGDAFRPYADILAILGGGGTPGIDPSPLSVLEAGLGLPGGTFFASGQGNTEVATLTNDAYSIFGQVDFDLGERTTITLGINYTNDEKDTSVNIAGTDVFSAVDMVSTGFGLAFQTATGLPPTPENIANVGMMNPGLIAQLQTLSMTECSATAPPPNCNQLLALQPLQFLPPFVNYPNSVESGSSSDSQTTWTARIAFDVNDDVNIYASAGTGFKATSWNLSRDSRPFASDIAALEAAGLSVNNLVAGTRNAGPEESQLLEFGLKGQWDNFILNAAIFDQEIEGFQSNLFLGTGFALANAGKQSTTGIEVDFLWQPIPDLQFNFASMFLDPEYDSFPAGNGVGGPADLTGRAPAGISETSITTSARYAFNLLGGDAFVRAEYWYESDVQVNDNVPESVASREVGTINASAGVQWDNGFQATIWGRNINDDNWLQSSFPSVAQAGSFSGYPNTPRTWGVTLRYFFD